MRFSEVLLKLGVSLVAWIVLYAHILWLAVAGKVGCGPDGDEVFRVLLGLAPLSILCAFLLRSSRALGDVHQTLRWLGVPLLLLSPLALKAIWQVGTTVHGANQGVCNDGSPALWETLWVPAQSITLLVIALAMIRMWWKSGSEDEPSTG